MCWAGFDCIVVSDFGFVDGFCMLCFARRFWCVLVLSCCGRFVLRCGLHGVVSWVLLWLRLSGFGCSSGWCVLVVGFWGLVGLEAVVVASCGGCVGLWFIHECWWFCCIDCCLVVCDGLWFGVFVVCGFSCICYLVAGLAGFVFSRCFDLWFCGWLNCFVVGCY